MQALPAAIPAPAPIRLELARLVPLEIWRLLLDSGEALSSAVRREPALLAEGLQMLHQGAGHTRDGRRDHQVCAGYEHLVVGGGRSLAIPDEVLARGPTPFTRLPDLYIGELGGLALAAEAGFSADETLILDLGQTSIKASYAGQRLHLPRDLQLLPRGRVAHARHLEQRERLREFLAAALERVRADLPPPRAVIFGLPGEVSAKGVPGRSTYAGMADDLALLPDALARAGLAPEMIGVLNDAALAAASAARLPEASVKTLVLTFGFGLGAALLREGNLRP